VVFKTHVDIFDKWDDSIVARLQAIAQKHGKKFEQVKSTWISPSDTQKKAARCRAPWYN
jgi:hypothetical protein